MDRYRLKNVIILILVLLNACLLAILVSWQHAARSAWNTANLVQKAGKSTEVK